MDMDMDMDQGCIEDLRVLDGRFGRIDPGGSKDNPA